MKLCWFHLMPYTELPDDFRERHPSVWVDVDSRLFDPARAHLMYNDFLDELELAAEVGFDGICVNEHHSNGYGLMPSLPGFPGATGHEHLDDLADWLAATLDLLDAAGLAGADLIGASVGGMLAAEVAALSPAAVARLVLVAPYGLFDAAAPTTDVFAVKQDALPGLLSAHPERLLERATPPQGAPPGDWPIVLARASAAAARLLWPLGDRGLAKRLHRIRVPTLLAWGERDRVLPPSYARRFAERITGPVETCTIPGAGHLVDLDAPDALAAAIESFLCRNGERR